VTADVEFDAWYRAQHPRLVSALAVISGERDAAVEATDEAFARALERWDRVGAMQSPGGWTYRVALNVSRRLMRRRSLERRAAERAAAGRRDEPPSPAWSGEVWDALVRLPLRQRTAVALTYVSDLPNETVAAVMDIAPGTVAATLHAARSRLEELLGEPAAGGSR